MASKVGICNKALIEVGEANITSLTDNSKAARTCNAIYDMTLAAALRCHKWNFAIKRVALAELVAVPVFGFSKQFQLPADCLRVLTVDLPSTMFKVEGRALLTDASVVNLQYVALVEDPTQYDSLFVDYFALRLASDIAMTLTDNTALRDAIAAKAILALREARTIDGQEDIADIPVDGSWINARI